jgi:homoserine O-acetyltransferase
MTIFKAIGALALALLATAAAAADYPAPKQGEWIARDFKFHTGEAMPEVRLHYTTIGDPAGIKRSWCCMAAADRPPIC